MLFTEVPLLERPAAAAAAGFSAVEFWWPWPDQPAPDRSAVDDFVDAVRDAGVELVGLNFFAGDLAGADAGVVSLPKRTKEFVDNVDVVVEVGKALEVPAFNALYGVRLDDVSPEQQDDIATQNLTLAAEAVARIGGVVLVEPVSGPKPYPLRLATDVVAVLDRVQVPNISMLCDLFHLANNGDDLDAVIDRYSARIGHVQIADHPGRHEPGTGTLDLDRHLGRIEAGGYRGRVALEYVPSTNTVDSLTWLAVDRRR
jgi:hydroxypyruvate isomerase